MATVAFQDVSLPTMLKLWRNFAGMSQRQLADEAQRKLQEFDPYRTVSYDLISRYERGDFRPGPDTAVLWAIAEVLGHSIEEYPEDIASRVAAIRNRWSSPSALLSA